MVVVLTAYTWYLVGTGGSTGIENTIQNLLQELKLPVTVNNLTGGVVGFVTALTLATVGIFVTLFKAETEKCPGYLIGLAIFVMLFAYGYYFRCIAIASVTKGADADSHLLENVSYFYFIVGMFMCTLQRYKELKRETSGYKVEAVVQVDVESRL